MPSRPHLPVVAVVGADEAAVLAGTPASIEGRDEVAAFFNGSAHAALAVFLGDRPDYAWYLKGEAKVVFDFEVDHGRVTGITFRAAPDVLARVVRRSGADPIIWLTRPGGFELQDVDAQWLAAARAATAEAALGLTLVVVTRHGWTDPRSGVRREWKRLRAR